MTSKREETRSPAIPVVRVESRRCRKTNTNPDGTRFDLLAEAFVEGVFVKARPG